MINVITREFAAYEYKVGEWVSRSWQGSEVYMEIRDRTKDSFTVEGNTITGDEGEPVYKGEEYDSKAGEFTGQMIAAPQSSLNSWQGPQNASDIEGAARSMTFEMDKERIFEAWDDLINMNEGEMERWENHPCSDVGDDNASDWRDNTMMLMGQAPDGWNQESYQIANRVVAWARQHMDMLPEDAANAGKGTCPAPVAVKMLNRGINPFESFPSGNPTFEEETGSENSLRDFSEHDGEELDQVYSDWSDAVNMTASQLERWADHPCANTASQDPQAVRKRNMMLLETDKSDWTQKHIDAAKRTISFIERMSSSENRPEDAKSGGKGTCPSEWAVSLLNWAYNPFDSMPNGEPNPDEEKAHSDSGLVYNEDGDPVELSFAAGAVLDSIRNGFNQYGIRKNTDENNELVSVDTIFEAMEPGEPEERNGVRITEDFLREVAQKDYSDEPPYLMDHTRSTLSHVGFVKDVWFDEQRKKLMLQARAYNTGADSHDEIIKRLTHEPPALQDGSVGFGKSYQASRNEDGERELVDGKLQEFSTTPFPAGYDEGGLRTTGE